MRVRDQQNKIRTHLKLLQTPHIFKLINQSAYRNEDVGYKHSVLSDDGFHSMVDTEVFNKDTKCMR